MSRAHRHDDRETRIAFAVLLAFIGAIAAIVETTNVQTNEGETKNEIE